MRVTSPVTGKTVVIDTNDADIRQRYNEIMAGRSAELKEIFVSSGMQYVTVRNNNDAFRQLSALT